MRWRKLDEIVVPLLRENSRACWLLPCIYPWDSTQPWIRLDIAKNLETAVRVLFCYFLLNFLQRNGYIHSTLTLNT